MLRRVSLIAILIVALALQAVAQSESADMGIGISGLAASLDAEGKPTEGHIDVPALSSETENSFLEDIFADMPLSASINTLSGIGDSVDVAAWGNDEPEISADITRVVLRFKAKEQSAGAFKKTDSFDVLVDFNGDQVVVRHSKSPEAKRKFGDVFSVGNNAQYRGYLRGDGEGAVVLVVPEMRSGANQPRGVMICPRKPYRANLPESGQMVFLIDNQYRLSRGMFAVRAAVKGALPSFSRLEKVSNTSFAKAFILTSPSISRSVEYHAESIGDAAKVKLEYTPFATEQLPLDNPQGAINAAIQSRIELAGANGLKRSAVVQDTVWIKEVEISRDRTWTTQTAKGVWVPVSPGACYIVLKEKSVRQEYVRGAYAAPTPTSVAPTLTPSPIVTSLPTVALTAEPMVSIAPTAAATTPASK